MVTKVESTPLELELTSRRPQGYRASPYPVSFLFRYAANYLSNGRFFQPNPALLPSLATLLKKQGSLISENITKPLSDRSIKMVFLGDLMLTKSGEFPLLDSALKALLASANIIVLNLESPLVDKDQVLKRNCLSLNFQMNPQYLQSLYACNPNAKWIFNIANNHACDTSQGGPTDHTGIEHTVQTIKKYYPQAEVIGADVEGSDSVLSLQMPAGPKLGFIGWTEWMNHDKKHYKKRIVRSISASSLLHRDHDYLVGLPHANVEQSPHPQRETTRRWRSLVPTSMNLVVGTGPHLVQPAEKCGDMGIICHSIGNFVSAGGRSQTKVGLIPEITLHPDQASPHMVTQVDYRMHFIEQHQNRITLLEDVEKGGHYPEIINRLRVLWPTLFSSDKPGEGRFCLKPYHSLLLIARLQTKLYKELHKRDLTRALALPLALGALLLEPVTALAMLIEGMVFGILNLTMLRFSDAGLCLALTTLNAVNLLISPLKAMAKAVYHLALLTSPRRIEQYLLNQSLSLLRAQANAVL